MDQSAQWGSEDMSAKWSHPHGSWVYDCIWGCFDYDFESMDEAHQAFLNHSCRVPEVCS